MKKKIPLAKQELKKDVATTKISTEIAPFILPEDNPFNLIPESEIIFKGKIKLDQLLNAELSKEILVGNQSFVDLFLLNKKYLSVYQVESKLDPASDLCSSYTTKEFDISEEKLIPVKTIKTNTDYKIKILQVKDSQNNNYVLKRCWVNMKTGSKTLESIIEITSFLIDKYTEYAVNKLYYACPYSAKPVGYHIIQLTNNATNQMMVITEMLSVFAGIPLSNIFPVKNSLHILEYFIQILHAGNFLEAYKIEHNDIKTDNFLVEFQDKFPLIKLIDFDIGINQPQDLTTNKCTGCRSYTSGYVAPEKLLIVQSSLEPKVQKEMISKLNPWKCHSYSIGVSMLEMIEFIPKIMNLTELDHLKKTELYNNLFIDRLLEYYNNESDLLLKNIIHLIILCLFYDPEKRASVKEILTMIENIEKKDYQSIEAEWTEICNKRESGRAILKNQLEEFKNQIIPLQNQNRFLLDERNNLILSLNNLFPEANISINDSLAIRTLEILNKMNNSFEILRNRQENEILQLRNALERSEKEIYEIFKQLNFLGNSLSTRINELDEYKKDSALKDNQIHTLNQKLEENENLFKILENENNKIKKENEQLKAESGELKLRIQQYEINERILKDERDQLKNQLLKKNEIMEQNFKENSILKDKFSTEILKSNELLVILNNNNEEIKQQKEVMTRLKEEIEKKDTSYQVRLAKTETFKSNILKIIHEKGFKIEMNYENENENENLDNEILEKIIKYLPNNPDSAININNRCPICNKEQKNFEMKNCIISSNTLSPQVCEKIATVDNFWDLWKIRIQFKEIELLTQLIKVSRKLEFIDLGINEDFDLKCFNLLIEGMNVNESLKGISIYQNSKEIQLENYLEILRISKNKKNILCLYLDKLIIPEEKAKEICQEYKMKINQWKSKNDSHPGYNIN